MEQLKKITATSREGMQKSLEHLETELQKIRAGKANPAILDGVRVDYYGTPTPLRQVATVLAADAKTLTIQPYERNLIPAIEKAIKEENLGLNPQNDGILIRITLPTLTEDRRKQLVKQAKEMGEEAKVAIRNVRRDQNEALKKLGKGDGIPEDAIKATEAEVQKITDGYVKQVDDVLKNKEAEIMKV